jgi:hypothetical protein
MYLDGKKNKQNAQKMAHDLQLLKKRECTFKPKLNQNYKNVTHRILMDPNEIKKLNYITGSRTPPPNRQNIRLQQDLEQCSFTPIINKSPIRSKPSSPRGFDEEVQRMRIAKQEREAKAKLL